MKNPRDREQPMRILSAKLLTHLTAIALLALLAGCKPACEGAACGPSASQPGNAQGTDTLAKIRRSGTIVLGHRESSVPFSYYNDAKQVIGYSQDLVTEIVAAIRRELNMPDLQVKMVPISPANRWEMIQKGVIDLECGSTGHTLEREQYAAFSNSIFIVNMRILTRKDYGIKDFADLAGKSVVTTQGTTNVGTVQRMNEEQKMGMKITIAKDHREAFLALESGQVDAFLMDDVLLYGERARAIRWGDWIITGTPQTREAYACIMARNDPAFKKVVDQALVEAMAPEKFSKIYNKWFMSPVPPKGIILDFPMSEEMQKLIQAPNDKAFN